MEIGKRICEKLKELRKRIADANDIPFEIVDCTHKGDCPGTCPKCESELRDLTDAIEKREREGKPVNLDGIMSEEELCKDFSSEPNRHNASEDQEDEKEMAFDGMPQPPAPNEWERLLRDYEKRHLEDAPVLQGDIIMPLQGEPMPFKRYRFAFTIAQALMSECHGNIVFSPAGLCSILEILLEGTDMKSEIHDRIYELIYDFNSEVTSAEGGDVNLAHALSIWYNKSISSIKEEFINEIEVEYGAEAHSADFSQKDKTKLCIDKWVADKTHNMIKSLDTQLSEAALMIVLDAIYMKAKWENPFDPVLTDTDLFHNADGSESEVDMMYQDIKDADYAETERCQVICLPYQSHDYEMIVVLPKKGYDIDHVMNETDWLDKAMETHEVELYMPRFKFDNTLSFVDVLTELGLGDMFNKDDLFPNITDLPIHVSHIKQQCVIDVAEEGTKTAAATFVEFVGCPPPDEMSPNEEMRIDRPFGFAIRGKYDNLLFMGVVKEMNKSGL